MLRYLLHDGNVDLGVVVVVVAAVVEKPAGLEGKAATAHKNPLSFFWELLQKVTLNAGADSGKGPFFPQNLLAYRA